VELRYGVLYNGVFQYKTHNERLNGEEELVHLVGESMWDTLIENVRMLAERGESCLVFVKAKQESRRAAEVLSQRVSLPAAPETIESLRELESTRSRNGLLDTCTNGVAFHNADLSTEERQAVEMGFRAGEIKVIVSTSTLAAGMNLPAQNVFISAEKWRYDDRLNMPWKTPILRGEYENMGGRAGRFGAGHAFGRSILVAATPFDRESLWRRYVDGEREPIEPRLAHDSLENHVLRLVAARVCRTDSELRQFLDGTLTAHWVWRPTLTPEEIAFRIRAATNRAADAGVILSDPERGRLEPTPFGLAVASSGVLIETGRHLEHWVLESQRRIWSDIDLLLAAAMTRDGRTLSMSLTVQEYERADYVGQIKEVAGMDDIAADVPLNRIRNCALMPFFDEVRAIKTALVLADWIDHAAVGDIEERYQVMAGQIRAAADQIAWLIDAAASVAVAMGAPEAFIERIATLSKRVQHGLRDDALPLARLGFPGLNRSALIALAARGLNTPETLARVTPESLQGWLPAHTARLLKEWALKTRGDGVPPAIEPVSARCDPALVVDDRHPTEILLDGVHIRLQEKQFRFIRVLAAAPGECIPYNTLYKKVWGDTIVNESQMSFQKRKLLARIAEHLPGRSDLVMTVPKRGFVLTLPPEDVLLHARPVTSAA
ncbi:MAG: helicase-related protein, partial [Candidatus Hydrogenedentes bacterium]|nr:helicase-related protein [Candidatus Hydrogenedentota bacterium]